MCWISRNTPKKSRAIRDIPVYKILTYDPATDKYTAPLMEWVYEFKKKVESILDVPQDIILKNTPIPIRIINSVRIINRGFHSYQKSSLRKKQKKPFDGFIEISTRNPSIHWYICVDWRYQSTIRKEVLCSAHIPKGASYYLNEWGEYVSDTLVIDKILDANKELKTLDIDKRIRARILKRSK